jgi:hypothetical protein
LAHSSLLGGRKLQVAARQHGCNGDVLGRPPEEWRGVNIGVSINVRAFVCALVVIARRSMCRRRRCTAARLISSRTALAPVVVPLEGLLLHRNILRKLSIAVLGLHAQLLA